MAKKEYNGVWTIPNQTPIIEKNVDDITSSGIIGIKGMKGINTTNKTQYSDNSDIDKRLDNLYKKTMSELSNVYPNVINDLRSKIGKVTTVETGTDYGSSKYDKAIAQQSDLDFIADNRANSQSAAAKIFSGIAKGGVLTATTFADGLIGTIAGIGNIISNWEDSDSHMNDFINNPFSQTMQQINEWSEKVLPNYYSQQEQNNKWYENIFSANFIGDKFIKNLGFMAGAAASGMVASGAMGSAFMSNFSRNVLKGAIVDAAGQSVKGFQEAVKLAQTGDAFLDGVNVSKKLIDQSKRFANLSQAQKWAGSLAAATGEGRIEAINSSKEYLDSQIGIIDQYKKNIEQEEYQTLLKTRPDLFTFKMNVEDGSAERVLTDKGVQYLNNKVNSRFDSDGFKERAAKDAAMVANIDFGLNLALLTFGDMVQFGKYFSGGYKSLLKNKNIVKTFSDGALNYAVKKQPINNITKTLLNPLVEGHEEIAQAFASELSKLQYAHDESFYQDSNNINSDRSATKWLSDLGKNAITSAKETYGNIDRWEEFALGALTGLVGLAGMPSFSRVNDVNAQMQENGSNVKSKRKFTVKGGLPGAIRDYRAFKSENEELANQLNTIVNSPRFQDRYRSFVRHTEYDNRMKENVVDGDKFSFKNNEFSQDLNDIITFAKANRLQDLKDDAKSQLNLTDEDLQELLTQVTNKETGKNDFDVDPTNPDFKKMREQIADRVEKYSKTIDKYSELSEAVDILSQGQLSSEEHDELVWQLGSIDNMESRFKDLFKNIKNTIEPILGDDDKIMKDKNGNVITKESILNMSPYDLLNSFNSNSDSKIDLPQILDSSIHGKNVNLHELKDKLVKELSENSDDKKRVSSIVDKLIDLDNQIKDLKKSSPLQAKELSENINDMVRLMNRRSIFIKKYDILTKKPGTLRSYLTALELNRALDDLNANSEDHYNVIKEMPSVASLANYVNKLSADGQSEPIDIALNRLSKDGNTIAKRYLNSKPLIDRLYKEFDGNDDLKSVLNDVLNEAETSDDIITPREFVDKVDYGDKYDELLDQYEKTIEKILSEKEFESYKKIVNDAAAEVVVGKSMPKSEETKDEIPGDEFHDDSTEDDNLNEIKTNDFIVSGEQNNKNDFYPAIPEYSKQGKKELTYITPENVEEFNRLKSTADGKDHSTDDYSNIYKILKENGAFEYLNSGQLQANQELQLMIHPEHSFEDGKLRHIFIITKDKKGNNVLVNALRYSKLFSAVAKEYETHKDKTKEFISGKKIYVDTVYNGGIKISKTPKKLNEISGNTKITINTPMAYVAIDKKGIRRFVFKGLESSENIMRSHTMTPGKIYVLNKMPNGKYMPVPLFTARLNERFFNISDEAIRSTDMYKTLINTIKRIYAAKDNIELQSATNALRSIVNFEDTMMRMKEEESKANLQFSLTKKNGVIYGTYNGMSFHIDAIEGSEDNFIRGLMGFDRSFQIDLNILSNKTILDSYIKDGILNSHIESLDPIDTSFSFKTTLNKVDTLADFFDRVKNVKKNKFGVILPVVIDGQYFEYAIDNDNNVVDKNGNIISNVSPKLLAYLNDANYVLTNFNNVENNSNVVENFVLLPDGKNWMSNKDLSYANKEKISELNKKLSERVKVESKISQESVEEEPPVSNAKELEESSIASMELPDVDEGTPAVQQQTRISALERAGRKNRVLRNAGKRNDNNAKNLLVNDNDAVKMNRETEMEWLNKVFPELSNEDRISFKDGLIDVVNSGVKAWGEFNDNMIIISNEAVAGTVYHEAFHYVFNALTDANKRDQLLNEAKKQWGEMSDYELEEKLAEGFREYQLDQDVKLGKLILDFFKKLFVKATNWSTFNPYIYKYYQDISNGEISKNLNAINDIFESNPELANSVYEALGLTNINESEITWTDEEGNPCAKMGSRNAKFTRGSKWEVVKDLKGYPSHEQGGVDIKLDKNGFNFTRNNGVIEAKHGLVLPKIK